MSFVHVVFFVCFFSVKSLKFNSVRFGCFTGKKAHNLGTKLLPLKCSYCNKREPVIILKIKWKIKNNSFGFGDTIVELFSSF